MFFYEDNICIKVQDKRLENIGRTLTDIEFIKVGIIFPEIEA